MNGNGNSEALQKQQRETIAASDASGKKYPDGVKNSYLLLLICLGFHLVIDNYLRFGIIRGPYEILVHFKDGWIYLPAFLCLLLQCGICVWIEKLLLWNVISEKVGVITHIFNSLLSLNILAIVYVTNYNLNSLMGIHVAGTLFALIVKFWSYASVNRSLRLKYKKDEGSKGNDTTPFTDSTSLDYPRNLNFFHLFEFVVGRGTTIYKPEESTKRRFNWRNICYKIGSIIAIHLFSAFLISQYVFPELQELVKRLNQKEYLQMSESFYKLSVYYFITWWLFFYLCLFKYILPLFPTLWGNEEVIFVKDWWNCENFGKYWSTWNVQVHFWFKYYVFVPLLKLGYSKFQASLAVGLITGLFHEYLTTIPFRSCYGLATLLMMLQIPLARITMQIQNKFGDNVANFVTLLVIILGQPVTMTLMYYFSPYNNI